MIVGPPLRFSRAALFAAAASACAGNAWADLYKCQKDGRTSYQERPCGHGEGSTRMDTPPGAGGTSWEGCYDGDVGKWEGGTTPLTLRVRRGPAGLTLHFGAGKEALPLRRVTEDERKELERSLGRKGPGFRVLDGVGVPFPVDRDHPEKGDRAVPLGIFRTRDEAGREVLMTIMPFTGGFLRKVPCTGP